MTDKTPQTENEAAGGQSRAQGANLADVLGPLPPEECLWGQDNVYGYTPNQMHAERERCYTLGLEARKLAERNRCQHPGGLRPIDGA